MKYITLYLPTGEVRMTTTVQRPPAVEPTDAEWQAAAEDIGARSGSAWLWGQALPDQYVDVAAPGGPCLVDKPEAPSTAHVWDWAALAWMLDQDMAREDALAQIEAERVRRTTAPIAYEGALLDADDQAQRNISAKLLELQQSMALGIETPAELLVWRDADNHTHEFSTAADLAAWLGGLAVAISQRGTQVYLWAWQQKAALAAAST